MRVLEDGTEPFTRHMTLYQVWKKLAGQYSDASHTTNTGIQPDKGAPIKSR